MQPPSQAEQIISNQLLRTLAQGDPMWATGQISATDQAMLCMITPDLAQELLDRRIAMGATQTIPALKGDNVVPYPGAWSGLNWCR